MKYFNVADDYVASVLEACKGKPVSKIQESEAVEAETQELVEDYVKHYNNGLIMVDGEGGQDYGGDSYMMFFIPKAKIKYFMQFGEIINLDLSD